MKIAVIGSGIAGLSCAWLLGRQHQVTLFERHARAGMGAFNLDYSDDAVHSRIDVPLRVFNPSYYPNLVALYRQVGVPMQRADHAASFSASREGKAYFGYRNLKLPGGYTLPFARSLCRVDREYLGIARDALRFLSSARRDLQRGRAADMTIREYLRQHGYGEGFSDRMLLPAFAAICTCSYKAVGEYPADTIIEFFTTGQWRGGLMRARHGADDAIGKLAAGCAHLRCNADIERVFQREQGVVVQQRDGSQLHFDHVVLAVQANQGLQMIDGEQESAAAALLRRIPYERSEVVVHSDASLLPVDVRDRAPVNFLVDGNADKPMASIWLNTIYPELQQREPLLQTWNPLHEPRPETVLGRAHFERPLVTLDSRRAVESLAGLQRQNHRRVWYCGSYAMPGIPLLESAVRSSMAVAKRLQVEVPWAPAVA